MRGFLTLLVLLAAGVVVLGFYLDWFSFSKKTDTSTNRTELNLTIDKDRIKEDAGRATDGLKNLGEGVRDRVREPAPEKP